MIKKIVKHLHRISRARRFNVEFVRRASFKTPATIRVNGKAVPLAFPNEEGAMIDFLTCFIDDEYGLSKVQFPVDTVLDIGANIGFFSMAARSYFSNAKIHCYEPNPRALQYLTKNAETVKFDLYKEAVGSKAGFVTVDDSGDSNQVKTRPAGESGMRIPMASLATAVERLGGRVDIAKIDCEGAEWDMFTDPAAWTGIQNLRMEYHLWGRHTFGEVQGAMSMIGFDIDHHSPSGEWGTIWAHKV
ncbi:MAG: FkbM family methyltransferase [Gallionella sp.]